MRGAITALLLLTAASPALSETLAGRPSVIDGDTLAVHGTRVRLHGIDAPESRQTCLRGGKPERCGQQSALALADRIGRRTVICEGHSKDRYGRLLAVCKAGKEDLNAWLVEAGWAVAYRKYSLDYVAQEDAARKAGRGLWGTQFVMPWDWRKMGR